MIEGKTGVNVVSFYLEVKVFPSFPYFPDVRIGVLWFSCMDPMLVHCGADPGI